jgi:hypothetical protein
MDTSIFDLSVFDTDTITGNVVINYGIGQVKTFKVTIGTLTWEEWLEPETAIPDAKIRNTKIVPKDDGTFDKLPNLQDIDYLRERTSVAGKRNALRVIKALEKGGTKLEGTREEKIKKVMNNAATFGAIWKLVSDSANAFSATVEATADSFRKPTDGSANHEDVPPVEAHAVPV